MEQPETNVQDVEQVEEQVEETSTNASEEVSQEGDFQDSYESAFDSIDLDNPDMSLFEKEEETNVSEEPRQSEEENKIEDNTEIVNDPFALEDTGYLANPLVDRGKEIKVTPEELIAFAHKGLNYERKNKELKEVKPIKQLLDGSNVTLDDIKSLVDLASGNKDALKHLISKYDVDLYDIDVEEQNYKAEVDNVVEDPVAEIWSDFQVAEPEVAEQVASVFTSMDETFREEVYNEKLFPLFLDDVKRGVFTDVYPETEKIKALNPTVSWIEAYTEAVRRKALLVSKESKEPTGVGIPVDNNPSQRINSSTRAEDIWSDDTVYQEMLHSL